MPRIDKHLCQAYECTIMIPTSMLMCRGHWALVPRAIQDEIWKTYRVGQENAVGTDHGPSPEYMTSYHKAVAAVREAEEK
jgi:hypothetical protein